MNRKVADRPQWPVQSPAFHSSEEHQVTRYPSHQQTIPALAPAGAGRFRAEQTDASPTANAAPRPARRVGIMGAGAAGIGAARSLLAADMPVTLFDTARERLDEATAAMRSDYQHSVSAGTLTAAQRDRRVALLAATVNLHHLKDCDVIVDALGRDGDAGEALLRRLNEVARPDAVLLTGAADGNVERVAALARFPANVLGVRLPDGAAWQAWELVPGKATSRQALACATRLVCHLGMPAGAALAPAMSLV
jgi:3-hydroxybutyryl-CoA dehydrogenase